MASTDDILAAIAPEVATHASKDIFLELAALSLTASEWGAVYAHAVCLLAAHMATLAPESADDSADGAGVAGPVTAKSAGDVSESYGNATAGVAGVTISSAALARTKYGLEFLRLRGSRAARTPRVITV